MLKEKPEEIRSCVDCYSPACNGEAAESPEFCPYLRCEDSLFEIAESELRSDPESRRFSEAVCCDDVPMTRVEDLLIKVKWKFQNIEFEKKGIRNQAAEQFKIERAAGQGGIWYRFRPVSVCLDKQLPRRNKYAGTC